jgi:hypothetical protein
VGDLYADGQTGSRSALLSALTKLQATGQGILDDLATVRQTTIAEFEQGLTALNGRHQRANRVLAADLAGQFVVSDFLDIDQTLTSATVRADSQAVTLRQRKTAPPALIDNQTFTSSAGSVEKFGNLYQVYLPNDSVPTGTFQIKFAATVDLSLLVFDLLLTPSNPAISVQVSPDGVYYTSATKVTRNGARVSAYLPPVEIRFLTIAITPSMPDNIGGYTYTFGLQGFYPYQVAFHLESQLTSKPVTVYPQSAGIATNFAGDDDLTAFVSLDGLTFTNVLPGSVLPVPGAVQVTGAASVGANGLMTWAVGTGTASALPVNVYPQSLTVLDKDNVPVPIAAGLNPADATHVTKPVVCWFNNTLTYRPYTGTISDPFTVSYVYGPSSLQAYLRVQLVSRDRASTPVFKGMTLVNA